MALSTYIVQFAPEWTLLIGACVTLLVGLVGGPRRVTWASSAALMTVLAALGFTMVNDPPDGSFASLGLWLTPLSHYARWLTLGLGAVIILVNWSQPDPGECGEYMAMILFSLLGVLITASANDWVVLFLALELVSIPTYVLVALSQSDARSSEAGIKYFFLGALAAAVLAYGVSFVYGSTGTTAIHRIGGGVGVSTLAGGAELSGYALTGLLLVLGGLCFKIAAVPSHVYAPDVYEGAASPVSGLLGFVPKFAGFVALLKIMAALQWQLPVSLQWLLWVLAAATMTAGNVLALLQKNMKRTLAYSSIAHTGYMLIALLVGPVTGEGPMRDGVSAMLFYIAVYGAMNLGAFALLAAFRTESGSVETLDDLAGVAARSPTAAFAFAVCIFSLMGFPPTAGFLGKLYIFGSAFSVPGDHSFHRPLIALAILGVVNSAMAAAYYLRIVAAAYWGRERAAPIPTGGTPVRWGLALCAIPLLVLFARPLGLTAPARMAAASVNPMSPGSSTSKLTHGPATTRDRFVAEGALVPAPISELRSGSD